MDAVLDAVHRLLLLYLHRVAQAQGPKEQLLVLLEEHNVRVKLKKRKADSKPKKKEVALTLALGPGDVSIMSILEAPGITWKNKTNGRHLSQMIIRHRLKKYSGVI